MTYLLMGDGEKDRELTKEEYSFLVENWLKFVWINTLEN